MVPATAVVVSSFVVVGVSSAAISVGAVAVGFQGFVTGVLYPVHHIISSLS